MKMKEVLVNFKRIFIKRKYKDILFRYVFKEKKEILQLYNAINRTTYTNADDLVITTMEDVLYIGMKNDLSFIIVNELNLYEHQSTINENMPLRGFLYFAKMYESYVEMHKMNRYQKVRLRLPFPRFIVFYNGEQEVPEVFEMRLSESFEKKDEEPALECVAKIININYGYNQELLNSCKRLHDYSYFVAHVRERIRQGMKQKEAIVRTVDECIEKGILEDVLIKHRAEVEGMFLTKFDKKMYEEALQIDARAEGLAEGRAQGLEEGRAQGLEEGRAQGVEEGRAQGVEEGRAQGLEEGRAQGRAEEVANTERERKRADNAEERIKKLEEENRQLKKDHRLSVQNRLK